MDAKLCIVCGSEHSDGLDICDKFICRSCEQLIVETAVCDERYTLLIHRLKKLWEGIDPTTCS